MSQKQDINLGTGNNTGDGEGLRDGGLKIDANFDTLFLDNVVYVSSPEDFPAAVGGVRELVPNSGDSITYIIASKEIDVGSDKFTITDGSVVIRGEHRTASRIKTTASGNMFDVSESEFFQEFIGFECPNAKWTNIVNTLPSLSFVNQNVIIFDCDSIATIDGVFVTSFRTMTVINTQTAGVNWIGIGNSQFNATNFLGVNWTGNLIDFGTATFDIIDLGQGNRFISSVGNTIISGAASSANLTATGRALVEGGIFNGNGTALSGIDTNDLQWDFQGNIFTDGTKNTMVDADSYLTTPNTITVSSSGVYYPIGGTDFVSDIENRFTVSSAGVFTYIGLEPVDVDVIIVSTVEKTGGGSDNICSRIGINSVSQAKTVACTDNNSPTSITSIGLFEISTGDTIEPMFSNEDSTSNIIVDNCVIIVKAR